MYLYGKNSLLIIPWYRWLSDPITMSILSRTNASTSSFLLQRLWKLAVNMQKLFALQRTGYWLMDESEEIDKFVVSNNLLATFWRPQLQHNHSIELLSWFLKYNCIHVYTRFVKLLITVISCVSNYPRNDKLSLKFLSLKLAVLLVLTAINKKSEIKSLE